jgi:hypothetical protein
VSAPRPDRVVLASLAASPRCEDGTKPVVEAFQFTPDLVSGPCTNTEASIALVSRLTGLRAVNILAPQAPEELRVILEVQFGPVKRAGV